MKRPLVSVVVPTYNNASLLVETLDGIKRQTFRDMEVIVVDDGSTDDTKKVVRSYDPGILYCYQSNQRQAAARNKGVSLARGDYIAFCDHDDIWTPGHLESLLRCFETFPEIGLAFDNAELFGDGILPKLYIDSDFSRSLHHKQISLSLLLWKYPVASMSVVLIRKECFERLGGLSENVGVMDDYHLYFRLGARWDFRYVHFVGCKKRLGESNLSRVTNLKQMNVKYLEDLRAHYPEVLQKVGRLNFRLRLGRKYFKLGRYHAWNHEPDLAKTMYWKAFATNFVNLRYLYYATIQSRMDVDGYPE